MPRGARASTTRRCRPLVAAEGFRGRRPSARARRRLGDGGEPAAARARRRARALGGRVPGASDIRETAAEVRRRIASCLVDGKLRGAAEAPAAVEEVAAPARSLKRIQRRRAEEPAAEEPEAAEPAPRSRRRLPWKRRTRPRRKEFQEELVKAARGLQGGGRRVTGAAGARSRR